MDKEALSPATAKMVASMLGFGVMMADSRHQARLKQEAELMNQALRELEARKMEQTIGNLDGRKMASAELALRHVVKAAAVEAGMDKEAIGALLAGGARLLGKGLSGAGKAVGKLPTTGTARLRQAAGGAQGAGQRASGWLQSAGQTLQGTQAAAKPKPLIGLGTKAKLLGGAAMLGGGYATMKGLQTARDYMMMPSRTQNWGTGAPLHHNVSQYGYATY